MSKKCQRAQCASYRHCTTSEVVNGRLPHTTQKRQNILQSLNDFKVESGLVRFSSAAAFAPHVLDRGADSLLLQTNFHLLDSLQNIFKEIGG